MTLVAAIYIGYAYIKTKLKKEKHKCENIANINIFKGKRSVSE